MIDPSSSHPAWIDTSLDSRSVSFENPTGGRGAGGTAGGGRKGAPDRMVPPGERIVLADLTGPGVVRHVWMTVMPARPERLRAQVIEVFYDDANEPSASVPALDFFGLPHGRPVAYASALTTAPEGRGFNSYVPMPFRSRIRIEYVNASDTPTDLYYQVDYTLQPELPPELGLLHVSFRRQNPTVLREDFVIAAGLRGPGRFLGCNVGVRTIDECDWYGEGEVKVYRDGDTTHPTICGTGLEDYVGTAWGMGPHDGPYAGAPLHVVRPRDEGEARRPVPDFVGFYRWHVLDPIVFQRELTVTIQQIGAKSFRAGDDEALAGYERTNPVAGRGWIRDIPGFLAWGIAERVDDYCATAFVYCREAQSVPRVDVALATADLTRRDWEPRRRVLG